MKSTKGREAFVTRLADENREFYGTLDGHGMLRTFELIFKHRWLYVFELVQNALDVGARSIAFCITEDGDTLTFQHDGSPLARRAGCHRTLKSFSID